MKLVSKFIPWCIVAFGILWLPRTFIYPGILNKYIHFNTPVYDIRFMS